MRSRNSVLTLLPVFFYLLFLPYAAAGKVIGSRFITSDTVWEGDIKINGIVKVAREATLTIRPGTVISFTRIDRDGDGVGEGALFLQGRFLARGTKDNPILFTSAEAEKARGDWDGINIIVSDRVQNILEFCRIEYAVRALHSHFSNVIVSHCEFSHNFRGIYFQEMKAEIENTSITGNLSGMRCRDSELVLKNNNFSANYWGADIFHSRVFLMGNRFVKNLLYGLRVRKGRGEIHSNTFQQNQLGLRFQESILRLEKNRIENNYETGMSFLTSEVTAQDNSIIGNPSEGVLARQSTLYFTSNTLVNNGVGFSLLESARADLAFNIIHSHSGNGIMARESRLFLRNNRISGNENGIRIKESPSCNLAGNRIWSNRKNGLSVEGSEVVSQHDILSENDNGVSAKKSRIIFRNSTIENNRVAGLDTKENSSVYIYSSVIRGNQAVGITAKNKAIDIIDSKITGNGWGIQIEDSPSVALIRNTISNNRNAGIELEQTKGMITDNLFQKNRSGIICRFSDLAITGNRISNNQAEGISATDSISVLSGNLIEENLVGAGFINPELAVADGNLIRRNKEEGFFFEDAPDVSVTGNRFSENGVGIRTSNSNIKFSENSLEKNRDKAIFLLGSADVDAENNWWGTTDENEIEKMIHDINDGVNAGEVYFFPYLKKPPYNSRDIKR